MVGLLAAALVRNPKAPDLWRIVFDFEITAAQWGTHHLGEGILILPEADCLRSVARARGVIERAPTEALPAEARAWVEDLAQMLRDYRAWTDQASDESFGDWCRRHGRSYAFPVRYYR